MNNHTEQTKQHPLFEGANDLPEDELDHGPRIQIEFSTGQRLAHARNRLKLSVQDVAKTLRLAEEYIVAIEAGNYTELPGIAYATGYVRAYAELVQLNPDRLINSDPDLGIRAIDKQVEAKNENVSTRTIETSNHFSRINWLSTVLKGFIYLLLISALLIGWNFWDDMTQWWTDRIMTEKIIELEEDAATSFY